MFKRVLSKLKFYYQIIRNLTKYGDPLIFDQKSHKDLWMWLSEHPIACKRDWPGWEKYYCTIGHCFACEYALAKWIGDRKQHPSCYYCPFEIMDKESTDNKCSWNYGNCLKGLYADWENAQYSDYSPDIRHVYAYKIANLKLKKDVLTNLPEEK